MHLVDFQYAKALLQSLMEPSKIETLYVEAENVLMPVLEICEMQGLLKNPTISGTTKINALKTIFEEKIDQIWFSFFLLVLKKKRGAFLRSIIKSFLAQCEVRQDIKKVFITTAYDLSTDLVEKFKIISSQVTNSKNIVLKTIIAPDIIGGYIMSFDSMQIDCSLKGGLESLKKQLGLRLL